MTSRPSATSCHSSSAERTPPGYRQLMATIAIGSAARASAAGEIPDGSPRSIAASRAGVGWSNTEVAGTFRPVASDSRVHSSTPMIESKPRSLNDAAGSIASGPGWPSTSAVWARTVSRRSWAGCAGRASGPRLPAYRCAPTVSAVFPSSQKRSRWKAYVGRSTGRAPGNAAVQSTPPPRVHSSATDVAKRAGPPSPRRSVPTAAAGRPASAAVSSRPPTSTGCGLISANTPIPAASAARTAGSNSTGCRRFANQWSASSRSVSSRPPAVDE